jgi:hypothetical protein
MLGKVSHANFASAIYSSGGAILSTRSFILCNMLSQYERRQSRLLKAGGFCQVIEEAPSSGWRGHSKHIFARIPGCCQTDSACPHRPLGDAQGARVDGRWVPRMHLGPALNEPKRPLKNEIAFGKFRCYQGYCSGMARCLCITGHLTRLSDHRNDSQDRPPQQRVCLSVRRVPPRGASVSGSSARAALCGCPRTHVCRPARRSLCYEQSPAYTGYTVVPRFRGTPPRGNGIGVALCQVGH